MLGDPRYMPGWSASWWADVHPLQIQKVSHITLSTYDLDKAKELYIGVLGGTLLLERENEVIAARSAFVLVGEDLVLELAEPLGEGPLKADMARFHHGLHALVFKIRDVDDARRDLARKRVRFSFVHDTALVSDPATTQGCAMAFTTWEIPGDPRSDWTDPDAKVMPAKMFRGT